MKWGKKNIDKNKTQKIIEQDGSIEVIIDEDSKKFLEELDDRINQSIKNSIKQNLNSQFYNLNEELNNLQKKVDETSKIQSELLDSKFQNVSNELKNEIFQIKNDVTTFFQKKELSIESLFNKIYDNIVTLKTEVITNINELKKYIKNEQIKDKKEVINKLDEITVLQNKIMNQLDVLNMPFYKKLFTKKRSSKNGK